MQDDGGVEIETGEFLWGLTRILKPKHVLTTGVYTGISDMYIAQGLKTMVLDSLQLLNGINFT